MTSACIQVTKPCSGNYLMGVMTLVHCVQRKKERDVIVHTGTGLRWMNGWSKSVRLCQGTPLDAYHFPLTINISSFEP